MAGYSTERSASWLLFSEKHNIVSRLRERDVSLGAALKPRIEHSPTTNRLRDEMESGKPTLVIGIGNLLMGDEGVGVHAIRELEKVEVPPHVHMLDGGTGGFHLLSLFQEYDPIIIIDATMDNQLEGAVQLRRPKFASEFPRTLSAHDIGLRDLLESATLLGPLPGLFLVTISIKQIQSLSTELSPVVRGSIPAVVQIVRDILASENHPPHFVDS